MDKPLIFISHKHADKEIAVKVAKWVEEATDFEMDVYLSSNEKFKGPRFGQELNKELRKALWRSDVLLLVYTTEDRGWSYCMWECGVANDASSPDTTMIVLQFSDDVPDVLLGTRFVDMRKLEDVRGFAAQLFKDLDFFPTLKRPFKPNLTDEVIKTKADLLSAELKDRDFGLRREWSTWPYVQIELSFAEVSQLKTTSMQEGIALVAENARVNICDPQALKIFELTHLQPGATFKTLANALSPATLPLWFIAACEQIVVSAKDGWPRLSWRAVRRGNDEYIPAVSRVRQRPVESRVQFDLYFYDLPPRDSEEVSERMLTPDRFFWRRFDDNAATETKLLSLNRELRTQGRNRLPYLDADMRPKYMIHRSVITEFLADTGASENSTLADLLANEVQARLVTTAFAAVGPGALLVDAARAMRAIPNCRDVFVTIDGTRDSKVLGWLTNVDLESKRDSEA